MVTKDDFDRINNDTYGNPRYVCHYVHFIHPRDEFNGIEGRYALALKRAKKLNGRKFHNKQYGGGIAFQSYNLQELVNQINEFMLTV